MYIKYNNKNVPNKVRSSVKKEIVVWWIALRLLQTREYVRIIMIFNMQLRRLLSSEMKNWHWLKQLSTRITEIWVSCHKYEIASMVFHKKCLYYMGWMFRKLFLPTKRNAFASSAFLSFVTLVMATTFLIFTVHSVCT